MATKLELTAELATARARIAELEAALAARPAVRPAARPAIKTVAHTPWVRPAHMEAARQRAMATGCVVKV